MGLLVTNVVADRESELFKSTCLQYEEFKAALAEARAKAAPGAKPPAIGAPHIAVFHTFVEQLAKRDIGEVNKNELSAWCATIDQMLEGAVQLNINIACQHFSIHSVMGKDAKVRFQFSVSDGPLRACILRSLSNLQGLTVSTGPAPEGFFEEELADWMSILSLKEEA